MLNINLAGPVLTRGPPVGMMMKATACLCVIINMMTFLTTVCRTKYSLTVIPDVMTLEK